MSELKFFKAIQATRLTVPVSAQALMLAYTTNEKAENLIHLPPTPTQLFTVGLRAPFSVNQLSMDGDWEVKLLQSERKINMTAVSQELSKLREKFFKENGVNMTKLEVEAAKDEIIHTNLIHAPVVETPFSLYYHHQTQLLISDNPKLAGHGLATLGKLLGTLSTETIHIVSASEVLAKTLLNKLSLDVDLSISRFGYGSKLNLKSVDPEDKRRVSFHEDYYHSHVIDLLTEGFVVDLVRLNATGLSFDLTKDFKIKAITFDVVADYESDNDDSDDSSREEYENAVKFHQLGLLANAVIDLAETLRAGAQELEAAAAHANGKPKKVK